ncbi:MAG: hypothetical protein PHN54_01855 [Bacilli bacterium]|nr:hypothetical protein [Bacilli bacterium]
MKVIRCISAIVIILVIIAFTIYAFYYNKNINYVTIDINPSVEFVLRKDDKVLNAIALNEDANFLLVDLDLNGMQYKEALKTLVEALILMGYIDEFSDENSVLVTAYSNKDSNNSRLTDLTISTLKEHIEYKEAYCLLVANGLTETQKTEARMLNISNEKMLFIERLINLDDSYTKNNLSKKTLFEIQKMINKTVKDRENNKSTSNSIRDGIWRIGKAKIIQDFQIKCNQHREDLYLNSQFYNEEITNEEKQAILNSLINGEKDQIKLKIKEYSDRLIEQNNNNFVEEKNYAVIKNNYEQIRNELKRSNNN